MEINYLNERENIKKIQFEKLNTIEFAEWFNNLEFNKTFESNCMDDISDFVWFFRWFLLDWYEMKKELNLFDFLKFYTYNKEVYVSNWLKEETELDYEEIEFCNETFEKEYIKIIDKNNLISLWNNKYMKIIKDEKIYYYYYYFD